MSQVNTIADRIDVRDSLIPNEQAVGREPAINKEDKGKPKRKSNSSRFVCPYCGRETVLIWVHGHYQCQKCKTFIESCCESY
jgi:tRNA(Ile2) C34 agmatinyltransferase TiaS